MKHKTATAVVCYKRPYHLAKVLQRLEEENIQNLYIFSDGPKTEEDYPAVTQVRALIEGIKWTKPKIYQSYMNLGCTKMIPHAVTSVLEENERVILLESDCVPRKNYFPYVNKCLDLYADDPQVMSIAGYSIPIPAEILEAYPYDVYFYPVMGCDGWATWKRAWKHFDPDLERLHQKCLENGIDIYQGGGAIANSIAHKLMEPSWQIWSINWVLSMYLQHAYCVYPTIAQIDNIGWDGSGVHCTKAAAALYPNATYDFAPCRFPTKMFLDERIVAHKRKTFVCGENEQFDYKKYLKSLNIAGLPCS